MIEEETGVNGDDLELENENLTERSDNEDGEEEETEVERRRRLAALGHLSNKRDEDDEEV